MFKSRSYIPVVLLFLSVSCASAKTTTPIPPTIKPAATLMMPTPTIPSTSTPPTTSDDVDGQIAYSSDQDGDFEIWVILR